MAVRWQIPFKSLRSGETYTVNIHDANYTGTPVTLKGGADPFSTQEDDDDDLFTPIRTQSGYIRIVDDGFAADGSNPYNWKDLLPLTDTDRPVTLTNAGGTIVWQGFMQAQNFGGVLYGNPQEREYPVQCALAVTECNDIDVTNHELRNFAYLLNEIISGIPVISITQIVVQGGSDARQWLLKLVDWQNFIDVDADGNIIALYNHYQCLEDICRFWGWTARTFGQTLYLMRADDDDEQTFLTLSRSDLTTLAGGELAGTTSGTWSTTAIGNEFASVANNDFQQRGPNRATVTGNGNAASNELAGFADEATEKAMEDLGWGQWLRRMIYVNVLNMEVWDADGGSFRYTKDMTSFTRPFLTGECQTGKAAFHLMESRDHVLNDNGDTYDVITILQPYVASSAAYATLKSVYHHAFNDGIIQLHGSIYRRGTRYENIADRNYAVNAGKKTMRMRLGVGKTRSSASWFNGEEWTTTESDFLVSVGNKDDILYIALGDADHRIWRSTILVNSSLVGQVFIEFLGSEDLVDINGSRDFDIEGFSMEFTRKSFYYKHGIIRTDIERSDHREYVAKNGNNVRADWNADCIYASDNDLLFGFGVIANPDGSYFSMTTYGSSTTPERPEQHLADRVANYWATAKRMLELELLSDLIANINPMYMVTVDGSTMHPIAIGRRWSDDVTTLKLIEI